METGLTKKEKRALAKEEKKKEESKNNLTRYIKYALFALLVVGVGYFLFKPGSNQTDSNALNDKFVEYAGSVGLNVDQFKSDLSSDAASAKVLSDLQESNTSGLNSTPTFVINGEKIANPEGYDGFKSLVEEKIASGEGAAVEIRENDHVKGNKDAKVVLIEYSDFQCPACAYYAPFVERLAEDYPNDILVVYRHFPLISIH